MIMHFATVKPVEPSKIKTAGLVLLTTLSLLFASCWQKQNLAVEPPAHPTYKLYGFVTHQSSGVPVREAMIRVTMGDLYQGEYLEPIETHTDSSGYYEFNGLYRAQYYVRVTQRLTWLYDGEVGIIEYADKEFNISIPEPEE